MTKGNKVHVTIRMILAVCAGVAAAQTALAGPESGFRGPSGPWTQSYQESLNTAPLWAQAPTGTVGEARSPVRARGASGGVGLEPFPWYERNNLHKYLGMGSIAFAGLTFISPKTENGPHEYFARGAAALGVAAVATGVFAHWDDIDASWRNPDTQHAVLGTLGTLGFIGAVARGGKAGHVALGAIGTVSMAVSIKLTW
jgi:hypothetical protein